MKLHLPKLLLVAVVAAASVAQAADYNVGNLSGQKDKLPSTSSNYHVLENNVENGFELSGSDRLGYIVDNNLATSFGKEEWTKSTVKITWPIEYEKTDWTNNNSGTVTPNVKVNGTLTVKGNAQVVLGGQYKQNEKLYGVDAGSSAEFTGIIAEKLLVKDSASVTTYNVNVDALEVEGGTVNIHTGVAEGNSFFNFNSPADSKQVRINQTVKITGGTTTIGKYDAGYAQSGVETIHVGVAFGSLEFINPVYADGVVGGIMGAFGYKPITDADSAKIHESLLYQEGGSFSVQGASMSVGGLNIDQRGGSMNISTNNGSNNAWHILADYGDSSISQSGDEKAVLNIGGIAAYNSKYDEILALLDKKGVVYTQENGEFFKDGQELEINPSVTINQSGAGKINIYQGINFANQKSSAASTEKSSITQTGGGEINLGGEYKGVVFDIMQSGKDIASGSTNISTINVKGDLAADVVNQDCNGSIVVSSGKTLAANSVNAGVLTYEKQIVDGKEVQVVTGGSVEINGNVSLSDGSISTADKNVTIAGTLAADNITVDNSSTLKNDGFIVVSGGIVLKDGATLTNNGTITGSSTFALMTADEQAAVILSETEDLIILEAGATLINEGSIEKDILVKGGTLTLAANGGSTQNITMESGTIYVTGQGVQTGSLTLNGGTINFADGATVALDENQTYDLSGAEIIVMVDDVNNIEGSTVTLFSGNGAGTVTGLESATFKFQDANAPENVVTGTITDLSNGSIKVEATVAIPEPTTATLSLLALAGLCARRRRR